MSIRTATIGSYPKVTESGTDNLPGVIDRWQRQAVNDDGLEQELQKVIRRVLQEQEQAGVDVVTDGQIRWEDLAHPIARSVKGIHRGSLRRFFDNNVYYRRLELNGEFDWEKSVAAEEFRSVAQMTKRPVKASLPGPLTLTISTEPKPGQSAEKLLALYADVIRKEVEALEKAGAKEIQIDEPAFHAKEPLLGQAVEAVNRIFQGIQGRRWVACYFQDTLTLLPALSKLQVDVLALDLVSAQEKIPDFLLKVSSRLKEGIWKKEIALGLVDARNTRLEDKDTLKRQRDPFLKAISPQKVWLAPSCGLEFLPHDSAVGKLKLLCSVAREF